MERDSNERGLESPLRRAVLLNLDPEEALCPEGSSGFGEPPALSQREIHASPAARFRASSSKTF